MLSHDTLFIAYAKYPCTWSHLTQNKWFSVVTAWPTSSLWTFVSMYLVSPTHCSDWHRTIRDWDKPTTDSNSVNSWLSIPFLSVGIIPSKHSSAHPLQGLGVFKVELLLYSACTHLQNTNVWSLCKHKKLYMSMCIISAYKSLLTHLRCRSLRVHLCWI